MHGSRHLDRYAVGDSHLQRFTVNSQRHQSDHSGQRYIGDYNYGKLHRAGLYNALGYKCRQRWFGDGLSDIERTCAQYMQQ